MVNTWEIPMAEPWAAYYGLTLETPFFFLMLD